MSELAWTKEAVKLDKLPLFGEVFIDLMTGDAVSSPPSSLRYTPRFLALNLDYLSSDVRFANSSKISKKQLLKEVISQLFMLSKFLLNCGERVEGEQRRLQCLALAHVYEELYNEQIIASRSWGLDLLSGIESPPPLRPQPKREGSLIAQMWMD